jgi:hypothetical protein
MTKPIGAQKFPFRNPEVEVKPELVFADERDPFTAAATPVPTVKVRVLEPYRVIHDGKVHTGGAVIDVPADDEHRLLWLNGAVEIVQAKSPAKRADSKKGSS